jgi:hypothetical protein
MCVHKEVPVESQNPTHWNLNTPNQTNARWNINTSHTQNLLLNASALLGCHRQGVSMTDFPFTPLLSPSSTLPPPSFHYASIPARKKSARLPKFCHVKFHFFKRTTYVWNCENWFRLSGECLQLFVQFAIWLGPTQVFVTPSGTVKSCGLRKETPEPQGGQ